MYIIKPSWLRHSGEQKDFEVYSCHISPDGSRLATAGGDGHVRVWSTEAIFNADHSDSGKPRQLCHMSHHLGTIHSVRFSPNGRYLASGADDRVICIYQLDSNPPSHAATFGTNEPPPVENWKTHKRLVGHDSDVQDLAWSYDNSILVSVGLDSKVVVWSGHTFEKLKTIAVHQSHVKGITFDPANKFFATAGDDRHIKIFRFTPPPPNATQHDMVNNFVLETTISAPFKSSPLTTYFRRCSWSPDGNHIAAANAVNGPVSSVAIIERSRWDSEINLIGHEGPTEVCMFSPRLFHTQKPSENGSDKGSAGLVTVIASAGQDKTLSIWNTNTSRPVVILQDVASKSISDLAWTPDGQTLFASSLDGSILAVKFETGELGWVATSEENDKALQKYGGARKGMGTAEDVDGLHLENHSKAGELRGAESRMGALMGDFQPEDKGKPASTNGTKTSAAKNGETNGAPEPKEKEAPKSAPAEENSEKAAERIAELKSRVQVTKDGKKRVAPLLVSSSATGLLSLPQSELVGAKSTKTAQADTPQTILDLSKPFHGLPRGGIAAMLLGNKRKAVALEGEEEDEPAAKRPSTGPVPILVDTPEGLEPPPLAAPAQGLVPTPEFLRPAVINPAVSVSQVRLAVPKVRSHIVRPLQKGVLQGESTLDEASKVPENIVLEAKNPIKPREPSHITASKRGVRLWQDFLPRAIILVTGNKHFWAAACEDGSLHTWTPAGRRLLNGIILESQPVILESREQWLLCITSVGLCHVFNMKTMSAAHPPVSLAPILDIAITSLSPEGATPAPGVTSAHLNSVGAIVVTLSNGDGFYYSSTMYAWQRLSESWWALGSQYWNSNDSSISALSSTAVGPVPTTAATTTAGPEKAPAAADGSSSLAVGEANVSAGIIPFLERHTTTEFLLKGRAFTLQRLIKTLLSKDGFEGFESTVSVAHLENRIAGALALGAREEFRLYLFMYAKRIGAEGLRGKVEELLNSLVGGVLQEKGGLDSGVEGKGWFSREEKLGGWERRELLKGVVLILGKFRDLQRLTVQYARILGLTADGEEEDGAGGENGAAERMELEQ
ncbi:TUP1-like enhancer of split-domain-containing protein [Corynascus novoguineensis]|uniref:Protein HIR n=1 Tax=Corynascus novoguineensis TaxID=1126955 RepID=A0AAN7CVY5_9PEZI|nr:TUP1-like enhancer of split-domain-containing protein [Corynascus novoguineensis]